MKYLLYLILPLASPILGADSYTYDDLGRVIQRVNSEGQGLAYTYDKRGNLLTATTIQITTEAMGLQATPNSVGGVNLSWDQDTQVTEFRVYRRTDTSVPWNFITNLHPETVVFVDSVPLGGTSYFYRIAAVGQEGLLAYSKSTPPVSIKGSDFLFRGNAQSSGELNFEIDFNADPDSVYRLEYTATLQSDDWIPQPYIRVEGDTPHTNPVTNTSGLVKLLISSESSELPRFFRLVKE